VHPPFVQIFCFPTLRSLTFKNFFQSGLRRFGESFRTELSPRGHERGFPYGVLDLAEEPHRRSFQLCYPSRMKFRRNILSKESLQFVHIFGDHLDRIVHVRQVLGLVLVVALLVDEDFLREEA
jgi:hypothetical protein